MLNLIDLNELIDDLLEQNADGSETIIKALKRQLIIDAIPVSFIRDILEACNDEGYRYYGHGIRFLIQKWREHEKENKIDIW